MSRTIAGHYQNTLDEEWGAELTPKTEPSPAQKADVDPPEEAVVPDDSVDLRVKSSQARRPKKTKKADTVAAPPAGTWILLCPPAMGAYLDARDTNVSAAEILIALLRDNKTAIREAFTDGAAYSNKPPGTAGKGFRPGRPVRYPVKLSAEHANELQQVMTETFNDAEPKDRPKSPMHAAIIAYELHLRD